MWALAKPFLGKYWIVISILVASVVYHKALIWMAYYEGKRDAIAEIKKVEENVRKDAAEGARNVGDCYAAGGMWDRASGSCSIPQRSR